MKVSLILADGTCFEGESFGYQQPTSGELVFNTSMTGYPELMTDPSSEGQLLVLTYPVIGNYGVQPMVEDEYGLITNAESDHIHVKGLIVSDYSEYYSHWNAKESLGDWMNREKIVGISGIDTRALTKIIRDSGTVRGKITNDISDIEKTISEMHHLP